MYIWLYSKLFTGSFKSWISILKAYEKLKYTGRKFIFMSS